jgi:SNF2 family DNA or RNA helicase
MSDVQAHTRLTIEDSDVFVLGEAVRASRNAQLFFRAVLGAEKTADGWRCPSRGRSPEELVLKVYDWLQARGFDPDVARGVQPVVELELERRRSFQRTREAAKNFKAGDSAVVSRSAVEASLASVGWSDQRSLYEHQLQGVIHALTAINAANFSVPGAGKTVVSLAVSAVHWANDTIDLVVVVGPLSSFEPWEREGRAALGKSARVRRVRGRRADRAAAYNSAQPREVLLLSYPTAASDQFLLIDLFERHRVMLVVDESHRIKRFRGGYWAPAIVELARKARARMILSGTPMPQSGRDLFTQMNVLWPGGELTGTRDAFAAQVENNFQGVLERVAPFVSRTPKSALGLSPYQVHRHDVPLTGTQADIYGLIENRFQRAVANAETWHEKIEALKKARPIRLLQAATNPDVLNVRDSYYRLEKLPTEGSGIMDRLAKYGQDRAAAKSERALELIQDLAQRREKAVCWSNFVPNLDAFSHLVRSRIGLPTFQIDGRVPAGSDAFRPEESPVPGDEPDTREDIISRFLAIAGPAVLVTNPASCSESISLHSTCHNAIYLDRTYDAALFLQSIDRIHRLGLPPEVQVHIHILLATREERETIDHLVDASLQRKEANMLRLLEGAELAPLGLNEDPIIDAEGDSEDLASLLRFLIGEAR